MRKLLVSSLALFVLSVIPAMAQFDGLVGNSNTGLADPEISLKPISPEPGDKVTATVNSYIPKVKGSNITWKLGGIEIPGSTNKNSVSFVASKDGTKQILTATFNTPEGGVVVAERVLVPRYLDIIIEPQTHVPSFYLGRSLPSAKSGLNATLLISDISSYKDYIFTWRVGRIVVGGGSQRGINSISFDTTLDRYQTISVEIREVDGTLFAKKTISVPSVSPFIKFYEFNPLLGMSNRPIDKKISLISNVTTIHAEPYYLDSRVYNRPDIAEWTFNRESFANTSTNPYEITLKRNGATGRSTLNFHVRDTSELLQGARGNIGINL